MGHYLVVWTEGDLSTDNNRDEYAACETLNDARAKYREVVDKGAALAAITVPIESTDYGTPPVPVWVLTISHKHGADVTVHRTEEEAREELASYVEEYWNEWMPDKPVPDTIEEREIDEYFNQYEEWYTLDETTIS